MTRTLTTATLCIAGVMFVSGTTATAREPRSATLAKQLVTLMTERQLESVAAPDPEMPDRFVAAMSYPGVQLLVMAARSASPDYLRAQLEQRQYSEVYVALQQGMPESKLFFQDLACDGLHSGKDQVPDVMYERGTIQTIFDGSWDKRKISQTDYQKKLEDADARYSRLLTVLIGSLQTAPAGSTR